MSPDDVVNVASAAATVAALVAAMATVRSGRAALMVDQAHTLTDRERAGERAVERAEADLAARDEESRRWIADAWAQAALEHRYAPAPDGRRYVAQAIVADQVDPALWVAVEPSGQAVELVTSERAARDVCIYRDFEEQRLADDDAREAEYRDRIALERNAVRPARVLAPHAIVHVHTEPMGAKTLVHIRCQCSWETRRTADRDDAAATVKARHDRHSTTPSGTLRDPHTGTAVR